MTPLPVLPHPLAWRLAISKLMRPREALGLALEAHSLRIRTGLPWAECVAALVGRLRYLSDPPDIDVWRSPAQTLRDGGGDCEDLSILAASTLAALNTPVDVVVGNVWTGQRWSRHAWVEGSDDTGPFLIESTNGAVVWHRRPIQYRPMARAGTLSARAA